jgi:uncharacterized protein (UPF0333 family)
MAEHRETHIARDEHGRVVDREVIVERKKKSAGFGWGMLFSLVLIAAAIIAFAYNQGSFQQAGVEADRASAQLEQQASNAAENTGDALETAGDNAQQAANNISDEASN